MSRSVPQYIEKILGKFSGTVETPTGWRCKCPSFTHGSDGNDSSPSLRATIGTKGQLVLNCRVGCDTQDILKAVGLSFHDLYPKDDEVPAKQLISSCGVPTSGEEVAFRSKIYKELLDLLELSEEDKENLLARGLSEFEIQRAGYKTLRNHQRYHVPQKLLERHGEGIYQVPGIVKDAHIPESCAGLVVPVRDQSGRIVALKTRRKVEPKYLYWTSSDLNPGTPCHVPQSIRFQGAEEVRVTEGEIKAHVATYKSSIPTIGISGVATWKDALPILSALGPKRVVVSMDWRDVRGKLGVCSETLSFTEALLDLGWEIALEEWDDSFKGIDDALVGGVEITTTYGEEALSRLVKLWKHLAGVSNAEAPPSFEERNPEPFPIEVFPAPVRNYIEKVSDQLQTPPDWTAGGILTAAGRALGTTRSILLDQGYEEMGNLYMVVVGPPGTLKTAAMRAAVLPLLHRQKRLNEIFEDQKAAYKNYCYAKKIAKEVGDSPPAVVDPPKTLEHIYTVNTTNEALVSRLCSNGTVRRKDTSILIFTDELKAWIAGLNMYRGGKGADKEFFLSGWSRTQYKGDRKSNDESITIETPFVCVYGGIQPDVLPSIESNRGVEDGFIDRLLFLFPNSKRTYRPPKTRPRPTKGTSPENQSPLETATLDYERVIYRLLIGAMKDGAGNHRVLQFTEGAWQKWLDWLHQHADETDSMTISLRGVWSKLRAYCGRFALIIHMLRVASEEVGSLTPDKKQVQDDGEVDEVDVEAAIKLVNYFKAHYKDVARQFAYGPEDRRVEELVQWTLKYHKGRVLMKEIYRNRMFGCKGKSDAEKLCRLAEDRGSGQLFSSKGTDGKEKQYFHAYERLQSQHGGNVK